MVDSGASEIIAWLIENAGTVLLFLTAVFTMLTAIMGLMNKAAIQEVHLSLNSRLDQLLKARSDSAHAAGVVEGESSRKTRPKQ